MSQLPKQQNDSAVSGDAERREEREREKDASERSGGTRGGGGEIIMYEPEDDYQLGGGGMEEEEESEEIPNEIWQEACWIVISAYFEEKGDRVGSTTVHGIKKASRLS